MTYPGGKNGSGIYQRLINLMPPHSVYIEAFLGGGALLRLKRPAALSIGVDLDGELIARWAASNAKSGGWILPPDSAVAAGTAGNGAPADLLPPVPAVPADLARNGVERSRRSHNAGSGEWRRRPAAVPAGADRITPVLPVAAASVRNGVAPGPTAKAAGASRNGGAISRYEFHSGDGIEFLRCYKFTGAELVYCDPPYLLSSRTSCDGDYYRREMTDVQHRELLRVLRKLPCRVMLSGYSSHLYDLHLKGWNSISYQAPTRRGMREEWCWFNYERPVELHDYRFLGDGYRERENLKKQQRRWKARLERMPLLQRQALLAAIADTA